ACTIRRCSSPPSSTREMARPTARGRRARRPVRRSSSTNGSSARHSASLEQLTGDHQPLDLAGAFADGADLRVAVVLLGAVVLDEAVAAVNLHPALGAE